MAYLLAKYALLFLLASILGFLLGRWWSRRNFVEVTESYESLTRNSAINEERWQALTSRVDGMDGNITASIRKEIGAIPQVTMPEFDLSGVETRLDAVSSKVAGIRIPEQKETDLTGVHAELESLSKKVQAIKIPEPRDTDLSGVVSGIGDLSKKIDGIRVPEQKETDLSAVFSGLDDLSKKVQAIRIPEQKDTDLSRVFSGLDTVDKKVQAIRIPDAVNLAPLTSRIDGLETRIANLPKPTAQKAVDLDPVNAKLRELGRAVAAIPRPKTPTAVDLNPVNQRLNAIEIELRKLREAKAAPRPAPARAKPRAKRTTGPKLFKSATRGKKDDLKKISGVGPKLEGLLNRNGVYYFWQVSKWNKSDIKFIDDRLQVFKGRISRDDWVTQAKSLKRQPGAAKE